MRVIGCASRGRGEGNRQTLELNSPDYANSLTSVRKDCMIAIIYETDIRAVPVKGQEREGG